MPVASTTMNACNAMILLDDESGNLQDISGYLNKVSAEFTQKLGEFTYFGSDWVYRLACKRDGSFSVRATYDRDTDSAFDLLRDWFFNYPKTQRRLQIRPSGDLVGGDVYTAYCLLENMPMDLASDEAAPIMTEFGLKPSGEITYTTQVT